MNTDSLTRKRIWEVDCLSIDASIAASFEWRELINLLQGKGHQFNDHDAPEFLEVQAQCLIHQACHSENPLSLKVEYLLNRWHQKTIRQISDLSVKELLNLLMSSSPETNLGGIFWALGTDPREGFDCLRRRFHQRIQVVSIRKMIDQPAIKAQAG